MSSKILFKSIGFKLIAAGFMLASGFSVWAQPVFNANFTPDTIGPGSTTTLTFTIDNSASPTPVADLNFFNTLPAGVTVASPSVPISECINGLIVAPEGGTTIDFTEGRVSGNTSCTVSVNVTSSTIGTSTNTSGDLISSAGNSGTASDDLTVDAARPGFTKTFTPNIVNFGDRSTLTFMLDNTLNSNNLYTLTFLDNLPVGMVIADPANIVSDCPDTGGGITALPNGSQISYQIFSNPFPGLPFLAAGNVCSISVDVLALARGQLNNTSEDLNSSSSGSSISSGKASDVLLVNSVGDIQLTQSFVNDPVMPGGQVELQFSLSSLNRNFAITDINFTNDLDATLTGLVASGLPLNDVCGNGSQLSGTTVLTLTGASLSPEDSCSFSVILDVPLGAASGAYPNVTSAPTGQITGQPTNGSPSTDSLFINLAPQLSKTFINNSIQAGENTTMEFTLTNLSAVDEATDIAFEDNLGAFLSGVQIVSLPPANFCGNGSTAFSFDQVGQITLGINNATLIAGDSCTFSIELSTANNTPAGTYTNTTEPVTATLAGQSYTGQNASADLTILDLPQLSMQFTNNPIAPGDTVNVHYQISSSDEGNLNASNITFTHDLDATLSGLVAVGLPINDVCGPGSQLTGTGVITLTGGSISSGSPCDFDLTLQVPVSAPTGDYVSNTSSLDALVNGSNISSSPASDTLQVSALNFIHSFIDDPSLPGDQVVLEYTIENLNVSEASSAMVFTHNLSQVLPGLSYSGPALTDPCGAGSTLSGTNFIIFTGGNLNPGSSCTFSLPLNIPINAANNQYSSATSALTATINGGTFTIPASNDVLTINNNLILLGKSFSDSPVVPNDTTSLAFTITNDSLTNALTDLSFTDDLDAVLSGLTATGLPMNNICGAGSQISGNSVLTFTAGSLAAGDSCTFNVDITVPGSAIPGTYTNITSQATGTLSGFPVAGDPAIDDLHIGFVNLSKSFSGPVFSGDTTTLSFSINNNGATPLSGLSFTDNLDNVLSGMTVLAPFPTNPCGVGSQLSGSSQLNFINGQLAANSSCSFDVSVQIPAGLSDSSYTNITSELIQAGLPIAPPATAELNVLGVPLIALTPVTVNFGDVEVATPTSVQSTTVSNTGLGDLTISNISQAASPFSQELSGSCSAVPITLTPGSSCTLDFGFTPATSGLANQTIDIISDSGINASANIQLTGTGLQALLALTPNPLDFGTIELNTTSAPIALTLSNNGTAALDVTDIPAPSGDFSINMNNCGNTPFSLPVNGSCTMSFQFSPSSVGAQSQNITFTSDSATFPDVFSMFGEGVQADVTLGNSQINFPNTTINTSSIEQSMTINNSGVIDLRITAISPIATPFSLTGGTCSALPIVLTPNTSCTLGYSFSPTSTATFNQTVNLTSNASSSPDAFDLNGSGIEPGLQLSTASLNFQAVDANTTSTPMTVTLSNTGAADLIVSNIDSPTAPFTRSGGNCGAAPLTLSTSQSCTLEYQFAPTTTANYNQLINIQSNATTSPDSFELAGEGIEPTLQLSLTSLDFGSINTNTTSNVMTVTLSNTGPGQLIISNLDQPQAPFTASGGTCGSLPITLNNNQDCTIDYQFTPSTSGAFNQSIGLESNAPSSPDVFNLTGNGLDVNLSTDNSALSFMFTNVGEIQVQTLTLTSNGVDNVIISSISSPAMPFTVDASNCGPLPFTLSNGSSCQLLVSYETESTASSSSFQIASNDSNSPLRINLNGSGVVNPVMVPTTSTYGLMMMLFLLMVAGYRNARKHRQFD